MANLVKFPLLVIAVFFLAAHGSALEGPDVDLAIPREREEKTGHGALCSRPFVC